MKVLTVEEASLENLSISVPEKIKDVLYFNIKYESEFFYLQTSKMYTSVEDNKIYLIFDNKKSGDLLRSFYNTFRNIENKICELVSSGSETWFSKKMSVNDIIGLFRTSLVFPRTLDDKISLCCDTSNGINFEIYNQKKKKIDITKIKPDTEVSTLLLPSELVITSTSCYIIWEISQMKVYQCSKKIKGYGIRAERDTETSKETDILTDTQKNTDTPKEIEQDKPSKPGVTFKDDVQYIQDSGSTSDKKLNVKLMNGDSESESDSD